MRFHWVFNFPNVLSGMRSNLDRYNNGMLIMDYTDEEINKVFHQINPKVTDNLDPGRGNREDGDPPQFHHIQHQACNFNRRPG